MVGVGPLSAASIVAATGNENDAAATDHLSGDDDILAVLLIVEDRQWCVGEEINDIPDLAIFGDSGGCAAC